MMGGVLVLFILTFPETLYSREEFSNLENRSYWDKMAFRGKVLNRKLTLHDFTNNFVMLKYWAIVIPCVYYMTFVSIHPTYCLQLTCFKHKYLREYHLRLDCVEHYRGPV
jgi:hypothetical protein